MQNTPSGTGEREKVMGIGKNEDGFFFLFESLLICGRTEEDDHPRIFLFHRLDVDFVRNGTQTSVSDPPKTVSRDENRRLCPFRRSLLQRSIRRREAVRSFFGCAISRRADSCR